MQEKGTEEMKVIIAGTRDFTDYKTLVDTVERTCWPITEIVSGGARGADVLGQSYATEKKLDLRVFLPDWNKHGKAAGPIRNREMAQYADGLIAFWDGVSRGTGNMITEATNAGIKTHVVHYNTAERLK